MLDIIIAMVISVLAVALGVTMLQKSENPIMETFGVVIALTGVAMASIISLAAVSYALYM